MTIKKTKPAAKPTKHTHFHKTITDAGIDFAEVDSHGNMGRLADAAGREADRLLLRAVIDGIDGLETTEVIARLVLEVHPEVEQQTDALEAYLMEQKPPLDRIPDGITGLVSWTHGEAGYLLGLAIGLRLGGAR